MYCIWLCVSVWLCVSECTHLRYAISKSFTDWADWLSTLAWPALPTIVSSQHVGILCKIQIENSNLNPDSNANSNAKSKCHLNYEHTMWMAELTVTWLSLESALNTPAITTKFSSHQLRPAYCFNRSLWLLIYVYICICIYGFFSVQLGVCFGKLVVRVRHSVAWQWTGSTGS